MDEETGAVLAPPGDAIGGQAGAAGTAEMTAPDPNDPADTSLTAIGEVRRGDGREWVDINE